jgi:hypothetical protein
MAARVCLNGRGAGLGIGFHLAAMTFLTEESSLIARKSPLPNHGT